MEQCVAAPGNLFHLYFVEMVSGYYWTPFKTRYKCLSDTQQCFQMNQIQGSLKRRFHKFFNCLQLYSWLHFAALVLSYSNLQECWPDFLLIWFQNTWRQDDVKMSCAGSRTKGWIVGGRYSYALLVFPIRIHNVIVKIRVILSIFEILLYMGCNCVQ